MRVVELGVQHAQCDCKLIHELDEWLDTILYSHILRELLKDGGEILSNYERSVIARRQQQPVE